MSGCRTRNGRAHERATVVLFVCAMIVVATSRTPGQTTQPARINSVRIVPAQTDPPRGPEMAGKPRVGVPGDATAIPDAPLSEGALLGAFQRLPIERTPPTVFLAQAELLNADPAESGNVASEAERLNRLVMAGAWSAFGEAIAASDAPDAPAVYRHALRSMAAADGAILPSEVLDLADASPAELEEDDLEQLGKILAAAAERGTVDAMLITLEAGTRTMGGDDPAARARAARLLSSAGLAEAAYPYLPAIDGDDSPSVETLLLHAGYHMAVAEGDVEPGARRVALETAWAILSRVLGHPEADASSRQETLGRLFEIAPSLPVDDVDAWYRGLFAPGEMLGLLALAESSQAADEALTRNEPTEERVKRLRQIGRLVAALLESDADDEAWREPLGLAALAVAAEGSVAMSVDPAMRATIARSRNAVVPVPGRTNVRVRPMSVAELAEVLPSLEWIRAVDPGLGDKLREMVVVVAGRADDPAMAMATIEEAYALAPATAARLAGKFLPEWATALNPNQSAIAQNPAVAAQLAAVGGGFGANRARNPNAVPLTRTRQVRSLRRLGETLRALSEMGLPAPDAAETVRAFEACHSNAEVFRRDDIVALLGPIEQLTPSAGQAMAASMRTRLQRVWRDPKIQQAAGTRRSNPETDAEVERGYRLALEIIDAGDAELDWRREMARANLVFDFAEFRHERDPDLERYAPLRIEAFEGYTSASRAYAIAVRHGVEEPSAELFVQWFTSALGASELGYLTRQTQPDNDQIEQLVLAIDELGVAGADSHRGLFAELVESQLPATPPQVKPRYVRHATRVTGEHPTAKKLRALRQYYAELADEVQLVMTVDGPELIGHGRPFGVRLALRFTTAIERESGGFDRYLTNQVYSPTSRELQIDHRDRFDEGIRDAFFESFEIDSITFHAPGSAPNGFGRTGWVEKPLAYVVLEARDVAVDRLPAVQIDMDFVDGSGAVVLPIVSSVLLVDSTSSAPRPVTELAAEVTLDDRELADGIVRLEVLATGRGVIPVLEDVLDVDSMAGFRVLDVQDHGINVIELDADVVPAVPMAERSWLVELEAAGASPPSTIELPAPARADMTVAYQRYADMDIVQCGRLAEIGPTLIGRRWPLLVALGLALVAAIVGGLLLRKRLHAAEGDVATRLAMPETVTPLNAVAIMQRLVDDQTTRLDDAARGELVSELEMVEHAYFAPRENSEGRSVDLEAVLRRWLDRAQG